MKRSRRELSQVECSSIFNHHTKGKGRVTLMKYEMKMFRKNKKNKLQSVRLTSSEVLNRFKEHSECRQQSFLHT